MNGQTPAPPAPTAPMPAGATTSTVPTTSSAATTVVTGGSAPQAPAQAQPAASQTPPPPADPAQIAAQITDNNIPVEKRQQIATSFVEQHVKKNPFLLQGFHDMRSGNTDSEAAQAYQAQLKKAQDEFVKQQVAANPDKAATPQGFGDIVSGALNQFQSMPMPMQAMMGIGVPLALMGGMSSLFGNGGMGMGILGLLGLGAAGLGGAAGGMFGEGASSMVGDAMYNLGTFTGMVPEKADLSILKSDDPIQAIIKGDGKGHDGIIGPQVETVKAQLESGKAQAESLRKLMSLPVDDNVKIQLMRRLDPSIDSVEAGQRAMANANKVLAAYDDPNSPLMQHIQKGQRYIENPWGVIGEEITGRMPGPEAWANQAADANGWYTPPPPPMKETKASANMDIKTLVGPWLESAKMAGSSPAWQRSAGKCAMEQAMKWAFNDVDAKELADLKTEQTKKYDLDNARRLNELEKRQQAEEPVTKEVAVMACQKAARCWAGYEPVPGSKKYSKGSCRPKGSKKTQKEMKQS